MVDFVSPDDLAQRRKMAQHLMMQGTSAEPVQHWTQGLARVLQSGVGGMWNDQAREGEKQNQTATMDALSASPQFGSLSQQERGLFANNPTLLNHVAGTVYGNRFDPTAGIKRELLQAQAEQARAHAGVYRAMTQQKTAPPPRPYDPTTGYGLNENNELVPIADRSESQVLSDGQSAPGAVTREHRDYGPYGTQTTGVPGLVTTPTGAASKYGTEFAAGQRQLDSIEDPNRQRLLNARRNQEVFTGLYGKAPAGKAYDANGKLISLEKKESVTDRGSIVLAEQGLEALKYAREKLDKAGTFDQLVGDRWEVGGQNVGNYGEAGRGFRSARAAVIDVNFALSGKSVSNAERKEFLDLYMPTSLDSRETQKWKMDRMQSFFDNILRARRTGATDEEIAGIYSRAILDGQKGPMNDQRGAPQGQPSQQPRANPATDRLKNKYGLE